ncbi:MAG: hypothetical protein HQL52_07490 [Magnetococcales bacterium]|nr:hypothetical protein [Magnetococcales bacterium]
MTRDLRAVFEKMDLLKRFPNVHSDILQHFGVEKPTDFSRFDDIRLGEVVRHVENCYRWFWPVRLAA